MTEPLSLMAKDAEDVKVLSAYLQDAILILGETKHIPSEKKFLLVLNRFRWEAQNEQGDFPAGIHERVHSGLCIDHVEKIASKNIDLKKTDAFLSLLAVHWEDGHIDMVFAGGGIIRLTVHTLGLYLKDLDQSWPTQWCPRHDAKDARG